MLTSAPSTKSLYLEKPGDAGNERYPPYRLDAADELVRLGNLLPLNAHDADRWRGARRRLSIRLDRQQAEAQAQHETEDAACVND